MHISDEQLSAFLDQELSAQGMEEVREAIRLDATLAERLAQLSAADALVRRHAAAIDEVPMPASIMKLLGKSADVVYLSQWQKARQKVTLILREHAALAASLALIIGLASGQLLNFSTGTDTSIDENGRLWASLHSGLHSELQSALDTTLSGQRITLAADAIFLPDFSFMDTQERHCRQYSVSLSDHVSESLACRSAEGWEVVATANASNVFTTGEYQPASGGSLLDSTLDVLMQGSVLSLDEENQLIQNGWR